MEMIPALGQTDGRPRDCMSDSPTTLHALTAQARFPAIILQKIRVGCGSLTAAQKRFDFQLLKKYSVHGDTREM